MAIQLSAVVALDHSKFGSGLSVMTQLAANASGAMMMAFGGITGEIFSMTKAFGLVGGAIATLKQISTVGMTAEQSMADLRVETGFSAETLKALSGEATNLSSKMTASMPEIVGAMRQLHAAGATTAEEIKSALVPALELARLSGLEMKIATDDLMKTLVLFGQGAGDAAHTVDMFVAAAGTEHLAGFTEGMLAASTTAHALGISMGETAAVLSIFEKNGIEGSAAGQQLAGVMSKMIDLGVAMKGTIGSALAGWKPDAEGFAGAIDRIANSGATATEIYDAFGKKTGKAILALVQEGKPALESLTAAINQGGDASGLMAEKNDTLGAGIKMLQNTIQNLNVMAFTPMSDSLQSAVKQIQNMIEWFGKLTQAMIGGDWSKVKTMLTDVFDSALKSAREAFDGIREGAGKIADAFKGINWGDSFSTLTTAAVNAWNTITSETSAALGKITAYLKGQNWSEVWDSVKQGAVTAFNFWYGHVAEVWGKIAAYLKNINGAELWDAIRAGAMKVWSEIESIAKAVWPTIQKYAENVWTAIAEAGRVAWEAIKQAWSTVDWSKVMDDISAGFDKATAKVKEFGNSLVQYIGLPQTFTALGNLIENLKESFGNLKDGAVALFGTLSKVDWSSVLQAALKGIDVILSTLIGTINLVLASVNGLIAGWQSLSDGTKAVLAVYAGTAGIVGAFILFVDIVGKASIALTAFVFAMQASAVSAMETFYIKLMLCNTSMAAFPMLSAAMVAGAAAIGVGLGLLIRQIPGVSDAIDGLFISVGKFIGVVEKEDPVLKANAERLKEMRIAAVAMIEANEKDEALDKMTASLMEQEDQAAEARNTMIELAKATSSVAPAVEAVSTSLASGSAFYDKFTAKQNESAQATLSEIVAMRQFAPATATMIGNLDGLNTAMGKTAEISKTMAQSFADIRNMNVGIKIELPEMTNAKVEVWKKFFETIAALASKNISLDIKLPQMLNATVEIWKKFFEMLNATAGKAVNIDIKLPEMSNMLVKTWEKFMAMLNEVSGKTVSINIQLPKMTDSIADSWKKFFSVFKGGDVSIPDIGTINADISSIASSLKILAALKGVVWA